jgi:signal transduction histidine kinase
VLFSAALDDQEASIELIERRLLAAALVALLVALGLGLLAATMHARRIRRLERAADRIAAGRFDEPVVDQGDDELGELAEAFDRMRVQLAQLDTARKEFIANASHELRTPLFSLGGFLELMTDEELDESTRMEFLATMREQVDRLTKLATDLLDLSRVDAGRLHVEREQVELGETARTLVDELRGLAETRGHPLELDVDGEAVGVGDAERVLQIGRALAGNALTHTPTGTRVVVRAGREDGRATLEVEDDGPGIPREHAPHVFDRFYRVEGGVASGSGLGLAIARELAELMGGSVRLESRPGRTVFVLELDAAAERAESAEPALV